MVFLFLQQSLIPVSQNRRWCSPYTGIKWRNKSVLWMSETDNIRVCCILSLRFTAGRTLRSWILCSQKWDRELLSDKFRLCKSTQILFTVQMLSRAYCETSVCVDLGELEFIWWNNMSFTSQTSLHRHRRQRSEASRRIWADDASETKRTRSSQNWDTVNK